jgi:DNA-binding MarR family transcriptional regulator
MPGRASERPAMDVAIAYPDLEENMPSRLAAKGKVPRPSDDVRRQPAEAALLGKTLEFMRLLWALDHALQKKSKWMIARLGVSGPQRLALLIIARLPRVSAGRVADILSIHPSTLTGVLQRLHRRGLITRSRVADDERRVCLDLTAQGRAVIHAAEGSVESAVSRVLRRTAPVGLAAAGALLKALALELEER